MAFATILRKSANSSAPLATRLTGIQKIDHSCIFTALGHSFRSQQPSTVNGFYPKNSHHFSTAIDSRKASTDVQPKGASTKISIVIRSFDQREHLFWGLPPHTRKIGLPESRVLYTVLRSPHIDKKSREQFAMEIKKQLLVIKTQRHELHKKFFWLKRQRILGAQYEVIFSCKTRLDKEKLQNLLLK